MKKLLFAVYALAAISLLAPSAGFAQDFVNRIGIYTTDTAGAAFINPAPLGTPFNIYFVVTNPKLDAGAGAAVTAIDAFEFIVTINGPANLLFKLSQTLLPNSLNVGQDGNPYNAEYAVGAAAPVPVTGGQRVLMSWNVLLSSPGPFLFYLNPTTAPAIPGKMAIEAVIGSEVQLVPCMPSSGAFANPVFALGSTVVPVESASFGGVKALFR